MDKESFDRAVAKAWNQRRSALGNARDRCRNFNWSQLQQRLAELHPGASKAELKDLAYKRIRAFLVVWAAAVSKEDAVLTAARQRVYQMFVAEKEAAAASPEQPAPYGQALRLTSEEAGHLTAIADGVVVAFVCRDASCLFFGDNSSWITHEDGSHYRCPMCGMFYVPWSTAKGQVNFQKVAAIRDPASGTWCAIPAKWPGAHADSWLLRSAEAFAATQEVDGKRLDPFARDAVYNLHDLLRRVSQPSCFNKMAWRPEVESRISQAAGWPEHPTGKSPGWGRLKREGFYGNWLKPEAAARPAFAEWDELIQAIGNCLYAARQLAARM
jgi:hypothetical protein